VLKVNQSARELTTQQSIRRGDIWMVELEESYQYMLKGLHPVVLLSNFRCLKNSPLIQVAPISSKPKCQPFHVEVEGCGLNNKSIILVEQVTTINKSALKHQIGKLDYNTMSEVESAISMQLGFQNNYNLDMFTNIKNMLDELEELDSYLKIEYSVEISEERQILLKDLEKYCINHSIKIDLQKFNRNVGDAHVRAV
jgi:mRNA interferase MazF